MPYVEPVQDHHEPATSTGAFAVHERQTPGSIDSPNDLEAREMLVAITSGDRSALSNLYTSYTVVSRISYRNSWDPIAALGT
jgi:hypothetical protein